MAITFTSKVTALRISVRKRREGKLSKRDPALAQTRATDCWCEDSGSLGIAVYPLFSTTALDCLLNREMAPTGLHAASRRRHGPKP